MRYAVIVLLALVVVATGRPADPARAYPAKLAHAPTPIPDRVILTWPGDPATSQAITWRTDTSVSKATAQFAVAEPGPGFAPYNLGGTPDPRKVTFVEATTTPLETDLGVANYHSATFTDLTPATHYVYRVGDGKNWSEWFQFRTASDKPAPLKFIYFGDAQNDLKSHWSRVVRGAYSDMPKADFILHAGDLINRGPADAEWGEWHNAAGWINGMVPSLATPGNHEYSGNKPKGLSEHWRANFTLPENGPDGLKETAYYIDVQGVRIVSLNSNEKQAEQVAWLDGVLKDNPNKWTILTFHHPIYSTAKGRDNKTIRELWRPLIDKYGVDLVLQGHDHTYGRSGLMREDNLLDGKNVKDKGTVYVVSVSGPKMYSVDQEAWMKSSASGIQLYQLITVDGDTLSYQSRTATGDVYDEFVLTKQDDGRNELTEKDADGVGAAIPAAAEGWGKPLVAVGVMLGLGLVFAVVRFSRVS